MNFAASLNYKFGGGNIRSKQLMDSDMDKVKVTLGFDEETSSFSEDSPWLWFIVPAGTVSGKVLRYSHLQET